MKSKEESEAPLNYKLNEDDMDALVSLFKILQKWDQEQKEKIKPTNE